MSRLTGGRPFARDVARRIHRRRSHVRCQPTTVSGRTSTIADRQFVQMRRKAIQNRRSRACKSGRPFARFIAISCCRSARFSRTRSRCPRSPNASARPTTINSWSMSRSWLARAPESTRTSCGEGQTQRSGTEPQRRSRIFTTVAVEAQMQDAEKVSLKRRNVSSACYRTTVVPDAFKRFRAYS